MGEIEDPLSGEFNEELNEAGLLNTFIDVIGILLIILDRKGRIVRFNHMCENLTGYSFKEVQGKYFWDFLLPEKEIEDVRKTFDKLSAGEFPSHYENHWVTREGEYRLIEWSNTAIIDSQNGVRFIVGSGIDVTEQRFRKMRLQLLESAVQQSNEAILITTAQLDLPGPEIVFVNPAFTQMSGYSDEDVMGKTPRILQGEKTDSNVLKKLKKALLEGRNFRGATFNYRKDGSEYFVEWVIAPVKDIDGNITHFVAVQQDVTERKKAEEQLLYIKRAIEVSSDAIGMTNASRQSIYHNQSFINLLGYTPEELNAVGGAAALYTDPEISQEIHEKILRKQTWSGEVELRCRNQKTVQVAMTADAVQDDSGNVIGKIVIYKDISEKKRIERQIMQTQKMEAIGRLAGGIAHDFNNMLTAISGYSELSLRQLQPGDPLVKSIGEIKKAAERSATLTRQLLAFSRRQMQQLEILNINTIIEELYAMLNQLLGEDLKFVMRLEPNLGKVKADSAQIEQVLMNLVVNARDAMPEGGKIIIETKNVVLDTEFEQDNLGSKAGSYVLLSVSDTGIGMDAETRPRVFEPFFTTKEIGKGTGLGLATVYGIVKQSEGYIGVLSEPQQGAIFNIYLPRIDQPDQAVMQQPKKFESSKGSETILLAEDEELVRRLAKEVLELSGYRVLTAASGEEALQVSKHYTSPIHLLISDIVMPGISGYKLAEALLSERSEIKILYMSGYSSEFVSGNGNSNAKFEFLEKPFTPEGLSAKVRAILDVTK